MLNPSRMIHKKKKIKLPATAQVSGKTKNSNSRTELRKQKPKIVCWHNLNFNPPSRLKWLEHHPTKTF